MIFVQLEMTEIILNRDWNDHKNEINDKLCFHIRVQPRVDVLNQPQTELKRNKIQLEINNEWID